MRDLINAFFGFNPAVINRGRVAWMRVVFQPILALLALLLVGSLTNYWGWKGLSMFIAFAVGIAGVALALRPEGLVYTAELGILSGIVSQPETIREDVRNFLEFYVRTATKLLFWISGIFFILGTISIKETPWAVLGILAAVIVIFSYTTGFNEGSDLARRVVYGYACFMLIMLIFSLVPRHTWIRYTGDDVMGFFASTEAEIGVSAVEKAQKEKDEEAKKIFLKGIEREIRLGVKLTDMPNVDQELYAKFKAERNKRSLNNVVKAWWDNVSVMPKLKEANAALRPPKPDPIRVVAPSVAVLPAHPSSPALSLCPPEKYNWEVRRTHITQDGREVSYTNLRSLSLSADRKVLTMKERWHGGTFVFKGRLIGDREYAGDFSVNGKPWGEFRYQFSSDFQSGSGFQVSNVRYGNEAQEEVILKKVLEE